VHVGHEEIQRVERGERGVHDTNAAAWRPEGRNQKAPRKTKKAPSAINAKLMGWFQLAALADQRLDRRIVRSASINISGNRRMAVAIRP
jgi:hypothetical protein